jgi:hypothetical protein
VDHRPTRIQTKSRLLMSMLKLVCLGTPSSSAETPLRSPFPVPWRSGRVSSLSEDMTGKRSVESRRLSAALYAAAELPLTRQPRTGGKQMRAQKTDVSV